eukprot:3701471-Rhodomonas_salina.2
MSALYVSRCAALYVSRRRIEAIARLYVSVQSCRCKWHFQQQKWRQMRPETAPLAARRDTLSAKKVPGEPRSLDAW